MSRRKPFAPNPSSEVLNVHVFVIRECIALFFQWQHPYSTLVDRDVVLADTSWDSGHEKYGAPALIYAACALGALMSHDQNIRHLADLFVTSAEGIIFGNELWRADITTSQALLLCSIFEAGKGNVSKSWMLSGKPTIVD